MTNIQPLKFDEWTRFWTDLFIRHAVFILSFSSHSQTPIFLKKIQTDLVQFEAIRDQVNMLLATRPCHPWTKSVWRENFLPLLRQLIQRTRHYLRHLDELQDRKELYP